MANYQIGDRVSVTTTFTDEAGTPTSPSTVIGEVKEPDGTISPLSPTETAPGVFRMVLPAFDTNGVWRWYIAGTTGLIAADQGTILVERKVTAA